MIETALRAILTGDAPVAALVAARVYPVYLPQAPTYPAVTYQLITGQSHYALGAPSHLAELRVQLDCWAGSYAEVQTLRSAVITALGGYRGTIEGVEVHGAFRIAERDEFEETLAGVAQRVWRKSLDFQVWFKET